MQSQRKTTAVDARAIALEMAALAAYALVVGVAVSAFIALPVVLLSAIAP